MKILFVIDTLYTSNNGTSISAQRYASELRKLGNEVRALCGDLPRTQEEAQITNGDFCTGIFHFPIFQPLCEKHDFRYANWDKSIIHEACNWADVVHVFTPFFMSNAAINYCNEIGKPVTAAFHIQPENITSSLGLGKDPILNKLIYKIFRFTTYNRVRHVHVPVERKQHGIKIKPANRLHGYLFAVRGNSDMPDTALFPQLRQQLHDASRSECRFDVTHFGQGMHLIIVKVVRMQQPARFLKELLRLHSRTLLRFAGQIHLVPVRNQGIPQFQLCISIRGRHIKIVDPLFDCPCHIAV